MKTQTIDIKTPQGNCDAYIAYPGEDSYPAVLFYMDAFGPRPYLYEMAQKLASYGYYVLLPNTFYRIKRAPVTDIKFPLQMEDMPEARKAIMPLFQSFNPELAVEDAKVFLDFLAGQKQVCGGKVGVTGYCMGGGLAIRTAARYPDRVAAVASFHAGNLATDAEDSPHRLINKIKADIYIAHADQDTSMPTEQIQRLDAALKAAQVRYEAEVYEGAAHGFTMADLPAYNKAALDRHWKSLLELFNRTLKG